MKFFIGYFGENILWKRRTRFFSSPKIPTALASLLMILWGYVLFPFLVSRKEHARNLLNFIMPTSAAREEKVHPIFAKWNILCYLKKSHTYAITHPIVELLWVRKWFLHIQYRFAGSFFNNKRDGVNTVTRRDGRMWNEGSAAARTKEWDNFSLKNRKKRMENYRGWSGWWSWVGGIRNSHSVTTLLV